MSQRAPGSRLSRWFRVIRHRAGFERIVSNNRLCVGNLALHTTEESVRDTFRTIGDVQHVDVPTNRATGRMRGFALVTMVTADDAVRAVAELDGTSLDGRDVSVNIALVRPARRVAL